MKSEPEGREDGDNVTEGTSSSFQESKREGSSIFRFSRFSYCDLTIKLMLELLLVPSWLDYMQYFDSGATITQHILGSR